MESRQEVRKREKESRRWNLFHQTNECCREKTGESKVDMCTQETTEKPKSTQHPYPKPKPQERASGGAREGRRVRRECGSPLKQMMKVLSGGSSGHGDRFRFDSDTKTRPCVVVCACSRCNPTLKVEARGSGVQSQPQLQESPSLKERCVGSFISPCVGEELVYSDSQFLPWATWVGHENAVEGPGRNDCVRFDMPCAKCPRLAGQGVLGLRSGLEGRGLRIG